MSTDTAIQESIERAASAVGPVWPLHSFVTANPLAGFEDQPFHEAVTEAASLLGGDGYPTAAVFRRAWEAGVIDGEVLTAELAANGYEREPESLLDRLADEQPVAAAGASPSSQSHDDEVDRVLTKWLAAFLDEGRATWPMPKRDQGFYRAFRAVARHDDALPDPGAVADLPDDPERAIESLLAPHPVDQWEDVFEHHLAALPGWTGFLRQRADAAGDWQAAHPITLVDYVAVRLVLVDQFDATVAPADGPDHDSTAEDSTDQDPTDEGITDGRLPLPEVFLRAWERSYRGELVDAVADASADLEEPTDEARPDAQLVFCIDTRSEVIRRHVERTGAYETHGFAGFFGVPMRYEGYDSDVSVDACPPIVDAERRIVDVAPRDDGRRDDHDRWTGVLHAGKKAAESLKTNAATAFSFVESAGSGYGAALALRTLLPGRTHDVDDAVDERVPDAHEFCDPSIHYNPEATGDLPTGLTTPEQVEYAASAFEQMGWTEFARLVVFVGHGSQTANNPFDSSLDCGACAGNPGGPNARVLAAICNDERVQEGLRERGFDVPEDTVFVAGEHNTTTDEVELFTGAVPESHSGDVEQLRADLETAREGAAAERAEAMGEDGAGVRETERRAADWAETRPEWGLAGNAAFVVGPRDLTSGLDLNGRSFLHSYDWRTDTEGEALEAILTGPMVVTQWINTQYYFATVDTGVYGSGSKVTHNPVGNVGVYQGNGGDLMTGLPLQSVMADDDEPYHQPLRLSTVVHAPVERVTDVLAEHDDLAGLLDNGWLSLTVVDPEQDHCAFHYDGELSWTTVEPEVAPSAAATPTTADD